ncbi:phytanoyl-CoA hydroxylase-interacting protein-like isoform X1 [Haliotis asinina]|uniref:phytanoyl-CoA hydroxylase-interacting protein-like isoform X1 n=1 Tax=Haliotis asinina TaxID=109174 RepID=UPI003531FBD2
MYAGKLRLSKHEQNINMAEGPSTVSDHLKALHTKAKQHCSGQYSNPVKFLYRNKSKAYFSTLEKSIMKPQLKDGGGDPRCPINGKLEGVFFGVTLWNGDLPDKSPYGDTRVAVPLERLFDDSTRLYFADFYCMDGQRDNHYVILVLTKKDTKADLFCKDRLILLDERKNEFLGKEGSTYKTLRQNKVWVEVFYTNEVDISGLERTKTGVIGKGSSTGGIRKTPGCKICNVDLDTDVPDLQKVMSNMKLDH